MVATVTIGARSSRVVAARAHGVAVVILVHARLFLLAIPTSKDRRRALLHKEASLSLSLSLFPSAQTLVPVVDRKGKARGRRRKSRQVEDHDRLQSMYRVLPMKRGGR